jgi:ABC-type multidrug transport system fused ATPase/permease subunit
MNKLYNNEITLFETFIPMISLISSFGPVIAISNLSIGLSETIACGKRVKNLLNEKPVINDVQFSKEIKDENLSINNIDFSYKNKAKKFEVLKNFTCLIPKGKIIGIHGKSGCGKSTLLKLMMRFWDVDKGEIKFGDDNIKEINTDELRKFESYLTQDTYLFNDTIEQNIRLANENATKEEIIEAAKKASIHNFIMTLPNKYDTKVGELGSILSSGERQRIGLARAFVHNPKLLILDEPTSNLDSLNEGIILKSILEEQSERSVVIVSHRESTLDCVDEIIKFQ